MNRKGDKDIYVFLIYVTPIYYSSQYISNLFSGSLIMDPGGAAAVGGPNA
jgi:hypothetical protein